VPQITIEYAIIGGSRLAVINNGDKDNQASTLLISYINSNNIVSTALDYNKVATIGGVPLSISLCNNYGSDPSITQSNTFYVLDIIENIEAEDPETELNPSLLPNIIIPYNPSDRTFTWNGNRLSASKKSDRYYINVVNSSKIEEGTSQFTLMGVPMGKGDQEELLLNKTSYNLKQIDEYTIIRIGGSPLTVGRIGSNYYLIISPVENIS